MPSRIKTAYKALKSKMGKKDIAEFAFAVTPIEESWSRTLMLISIFNNAHVSVTGDPPTLTLQYGTQYPEKELFVIGHRTAVINDKVVSLCYFCYQHNDVTYYVTARGSHVVLQAFESEPDVNTSDGRLFETTIDKTWCLFKSFGSKDLYLCHDSSGFGVKTQSGAEKNEFLFDLLSQRDT